MADDTIDPTPEQVRAWTLGWEAGRGDGPGVQHRRHRLRLDLEADTLRELWDRLTSLAEQMDFEERTDAHITSGGYSSGFDLTLTTDPDMTAERYATYLQEKPWRKTKA